MNPNQRLSAAAAAADPQLTVPARPCVVPGLVPVPLGDGLAIVGTGSRQVLRGRTATTLLPRLLAELDGSRTVPELAESERACVSLLHASGILQDGPADPARTGPVADYLGRHLDTTRVNRSRDQACERLAGTRVVIAGPEPLATRLRAELIGSGVDAYGWGEPGDFVIAVDDGDADAMAAVDRACAEAGTSWLRTAVGSRTVEVGPLFDARYTCCYECFAGDVPAPAGVPSTARLATWAALTTTEAVHLLSRVGQSSAIAGCTVFDLADWTQTSIGAYRRPGCPRCLPTEAPAPDGPALAYLYEQAVAPTPREWVNRKEQQQQCRPASMALQRYHKEYPSAPRIALADQTGATLAALAALLLRTVGLRDDETGKVSRWAPTAGNLGSTQAYLLAADVPGLDPGWYFYQRGDHSLARLRTDDRTPDRPAATVVLTGALGTVGAKFQGLAYRMVCLDAGVALAQLAALADQHGLAARFNDRWDDLALSTTLGLDAVAEPVTAVVALNPRNDDALDD
jgi:SagB-type dehydrogenase family enzyme